MHVQFHSLQEFLDEITKEAPNLAYVRATRVYTRHPTVALQRVTVVATARIGDVILRIDRFCGEIMVVLEDETTERAQNLAIGVTRRIEQRCAELGLGIRAGIWTDPRAAGIEP